MKSLPLKYDDLCDRAAAVSLLNDTQGSNTSLAEIVPEMQVLCTRCREAWLAQNRPADDGSEVAAAWEAREATVALNVALAGAFATIRAAVDTASEPITAALLAALEPEWAEVIIESAPLSAHDQGKRSAQRTALAGATTSLHEALVNARTGALLGGLSDGAASYAITRV